MPDLPLREGETVRLDDNYIGYIGFRNATTDNTKLVDDGAINVVVDTCNKEALKIEQKLELTAICN